MEKIKKRTKIILRVLCFILVACVILVVAGYKYMNRLNMVSLNVGEAKTEKEIKEKLNISEETEKKSLEHNVENILILGVDNDENVSDAIMVLSIDRGTNTLKLTSIMRDLYIDLPGDADKINYAYNIGGVEYTISTLNTLFNLDIKKYAKIDFNGFVSIIDYFGGLELNITEAERFVINDKLAIDGVYDENRVTQSGDVLLNGHQALAYSRVRIIDSDFVRTQRMRNVMLGILGKIKEASITEYPKIIADLSSNITTNIEFMDMLNIAKFIVSINQNNIKQFRIPIDNSTMDSDTNGVYNLKWNVEENINALQNFIYD
ncbi:MAG: LCP family protein [Clostridium sp.]|nr:LCP family protein [Clostridium sp.]